PRPQDAIGDSAPGTVQAIAFGQHHALAIDGLGYLYSWGRDSRGQLGLGGNENVNRPQWLGETITGLLPERLRIDMYSGADEWAHSGSAGFAYGDGLQSFYETGLAPTRIFSHFAQRITREEFAYALVNMYTGIGPEAQIPSTKANSFRDINNSPYKDQILKAYNLGIINGRSNTAFAPEDSISRQDAATMADRFIDKMLDRPALPTDAYSVTRVYGDGARVAEYARAAVLNLYNDNIMVGSGNRFNPGDQITRQEVFMILQRTIMKYNFTVAS
ncbi:MAG: S-layer homology domain-containing protein, partial [Oscillospiraceae bacterium]|nr:S-layer homology domain-containing protein [Oscillospiraceae bacterium]